MIEPWPCNIAPGEGEGWWAVKNETELVFFCNEKDARQYAALPVMLELARQVVAYSCESYVREDIVIAARAALKAAREKVDD